MKKQNRQYFFEPLFLYAEQLIVDALYGKRKAFMNEYK